MGTETFRKNKLKSKLIIYNIRNQSIKGIVEEKYEKLSRDGEITIFLNNEKESLIGFTISAGIPDEKTYLVYSSNGKKIIKDNIKLITENNYSIFFKYLNNYNNNLFVCDFENMDYFWLCKLYNKKSSVELVK